ncbi:DNA cytosine methyltransferase [Paraburkholderia saeva]|uniref:DNA (cytosine-5-)-methyltransferase n=1 Tax=Paraburkholderia saeva TaxID=2777537 RepID=A0A9N8RSA0_9BURK|nr:DNA (cytosine-5-)-methyltransferase [Paraburkholderia saeva]CAG4886944.1 Modification methylase HaeIII [Paraburkholderia saeva]CAG4887042.1 Modification methylase HaeIII [Paraburkholderia saeva]
MTTSQHTVNALQSSLSGINSNAETSTRPLECVELFAGCGAMALGLQQAGFIHPVMVDVDAYACRTLSANRTAFGKSDRLSITQTDVRHVDWQAYAGIDLIAGGPPSQPFSGGGLGAGQHDHRDLWPEAIRAVSEALPRAFVFESTPGLLRPSFSQYLDRLVARLEQPCSIQEDMHYKVTVVPLNAADYGVAQNLRRVLIAGIREDCGNLLKFPAPTHNHERLVWDKWVSGEYWERHGLVRPDASFVPKEEVSIYKRLLKGNTRPAGAAWRTCRDALANNGTAAPAARFEDCTVRRAARQYPGHTGSQLDLPSKALKAGVHGVPGGENMFIDDKGACWQFTVRDAARLQGLPDNFVVEGSWSQGMRQLGNALPVPVATVTGLWLNDCLNLPV